jgi:3-methylcrotonyl-CoA carboxylase beta subunit
MTGIGTQADPQGAAFRENFDAFEGLLEDLRNRSVEARKGGGEKARLRHESRGKLPVRDRVEILLDPRTASAPR